MSGADKLKVCKKRTKKVGMTLGHTVDADGICEGCGMDVPLATACANCRCRLPHRYDAETCDCGIVWRHQDNGPTSGVRLVAASGTTGERER